MARLVYVCVGAVLLLLVLLFQGLARALMNVYGADDPLWPSADESSR
jgi:hypothetical protein